MQLAANEATSQIQMAASPLQLSPRDVCVTSYSAHLYADTAPDEPTVQHLQALTKNLLRERELLRQRQHELERMLHDTGAHATAPGSGAANTKAPPSSSHGTRPSSVVGNAAGRQDMRRSAPEPGGRGWRAERKQDVENELAAGMAIAGVPMGLATQPSRVRVRKARLQELCVQGSRGKESAKGQCAEPAIRAPGAVSQWPKQRLSAGEPAGTCGAPVCVCGTSEDSTCPPRPHREQGDVHRKGSGAIERALRARDRLRAARMGQEQPGHALEHSRRRCEGPGLDAAGAVAPVEAGRWGRGWR